MIGLEAVAKPALGICSPCNFCLNSDQGVPARTINIGHASPPASEQAEYPHERRS